VKLDPQSNFATPQCFLSDATGNVTRRREIVDHATGGVKTIRELEDILGVADAGKNGVKLTADGSCSAPYGGWSPRCAKHREYPATAGHSRIISVDVANVAATMCPRRDIETFRGVTVQITLHRFECRSPYPCYVGSLISSSGGWRGESDDGLSRTYSCSGGSRSFPIIHLPKQAVSRTAGLRSPSHPIDKCSFRRWTLSHLAGHRPFQRHRDNIVAGHWVRISVPMRFSSCRRRRERLRRALSRASVSKDVMQGPGRPRFGP